MHDERASTAAQIASAIACSAFSLVEMLRELIDEADGNAARLSAMRALAEGIGRMADDCLGLSCRLPAGFAGVQGVNGLAQQLARLVGHLPGRGGAVAGLGKRVAQRRSQPHLSPLPGRCGGEIAVKSTTCNLSPCTLLHVPRTLGREYSGGAGVN